MEMIVNFWYTLLTMLRDVAPIVAILFGFQVLVLRRPIKNPARIVAGMLYVLVGLTLFLEGLEMALFPLGRLMAEQLTASSHSLGAEVASINDMLREFQTGQALGAPKAVGTDEAARPHPSPARKLGRRVANAFGDSAAPAESWEEF